MVVRDGERWVVVDGYKRVRALHRLGQDVVRAAERMLSELDALLLERMMRASDGNSAIEQGWLLRELGQRFGLGLDELGRRFDRSTSWVSRRLGLKDLPASVQEQVRAGAIGAHAAMKYPVPLARANAADCEAPLHVAPGVTEATSRRVALIIPRLRLAHEQKVQVEREIEIVLEQLMAPTEGKAEHRDALLLQSLPGLGTLVCATMLAEAWEPLRSRDYRSLRTLCGVAPVTKRSGKQLAVQMRHGCSRRLRTAVHYWVDNAVKRDAHWKARYAALRASGHSHGRALRGVGDRLLATLVTVLVTDTPYDASRRRGVTGPAPELAVHA